MREFFTSVLAGVASAVVWETIRWVFASIRAQKSPPILTRPSGLDTLRGDGSVPSLVVSHCSIERISFQSKDARFVMNAL